jgi:hypothetical protein
VDWSLSGSQQQLVKTRRTAGRTSEPADHPGLYCPKAITGGINVSTAISAVWNVANRKFERGNIEAGWRGKNEWQKIK